MPKKAEDLPLDRKTWQVCISTLNPSPDARINIQTEIVNRERIFFLVWWVRVSLGVKVRVSVEVRVRVRVSNLLGSG